MCRHRWIGPPRTVRSVAVRILILEDDPPRRDRLVAAAGAGRAVCRAPAADAEATIRRESPAIVVLGPAVTDGAEAIELVRRLQTRHPEIAVLMVSARDAAAPAVAALQAGAAKQRAIAKPRHP